MPPNRKQVAVCANPLADNLQLVQPKYLPLTHTSSSSAVRANAGIHPSEQTAAPSDDYWNWPAKVPSRRKDLFSVLHLESNLVEEASKLSQKTSRSAAEQTKIASDSYWAEESEPIIVVNNQANQAVSQETGYWDWPEAEQMKDVQIALILREELARKQVSVDTIQEQLVEQSQSRTLNPWQQKAENDSYWTWEAPTKVHANAGEIQASYWEWTADESCDDSMSAQQQRKSHLIASLLQYEATRQLLSVAHTEGTSSCSVLHSSSKCGAPSNKHASFQPVESDHYWTWRAQEDDYWNMRPVPAMTAQKGYWDW